MYKHHLKHIVRSQIGMSTCLLSGFVNAGLMGTSKQLCRAETEIVIEGFPRSGNSFSVQAFRSANPKVSRIATHLHAPANVLIGVKKEIPTLVVIRNPVEAVCSMRALSIEVSVREKVDNPNVITPLARLFSDYIGFHRKLMGSQKRFVTASFDTVTTDFGKVIDAINSKFETVFHRFDHTDSNVKTIREQAGYHALPNEKRAEIKKDVYQDFDRTRNTYERRIAKSMEIYECFLKNAV